MVKIQMPRPGWNGIRDLIMAKDGVGILHISTGLEIDIGVMAELREVLESRGWESGVTALLWQVRSASLTGCKVWLCHFLGEVWGRFGLQNHGCGHSPSQHRPCTKQGPKTPQEWRYRSIKSPLEGKCSVSAHSNS